MADIERAKWLTGLAPGLRTAESIRPVAGHRYALERLVRGSVRVGPAGPYYQVHCPVANFQAPLLQQLLAQHRQGVGVPLALLDEELRHFVRHFPDQALFLDIETCGLSMTPLFLIGLVRADAGELILEQLFARDYSEERAILGRFWELLGSYRVLVTYNGKAFDWPVIRDRSTVHRLEQFGAWAGPWGTDRDAAGIGLPLVHCDLLHHARRHWKKRLNLLDCRLQTLEAALCRRYRAGDLSGWQIPEAYHRYVASGDARQICQVLYHNALDLITLSELSLVTALDIGSRFRP